MKPEEEVKKRSEAPASVSPTLWRFSTPESSRTSILDTPSSIIENEVSPNLSLQDLTQLARTSKGINSLFKQPLIKASLPIDLPILLKYVAFGKQNETEAMLKRNPGLALASGTVTDHANRTFKNITGFQYAVWALDWHMWKMIKEYLSVEAAREQAKGFAEGSWVKEHGEHADWKKLTEAQQTLIDNFQTWSWETIKEYWLEQIGGAQFLLPIHALQEYNQPGRPFYPSPKFNVDYYCLCRDKAAWMTDEGLLTLGKTLVVGRGARKNGVLKYRHIVNTPAYFDSYILKRSLRADQVAIAELFKTRTNQRAQMVAELATKPGVSASSALITGLASSPAMPLRFSTSSSSSSSVSASAGSSASIQHSNERGRRDSRSECRIS